MGAPVDISEEEIEATFPNIPGISVMNLASSPSLRYALGFSLGVPVFITAAYKCLSSPEACYASTTALWHTLTNSLASWDGLKQFFLEHTFVNLLLIGDWVGQHAFGKTFEIGATLGLGVATTAIPLVIGLAVYAYINKANLSSKVHDAIQSVGQLLRLSAKNPSRATPAETEMQEISHEDTQDIPSETPASTEEDGLRKRRTASPAGRLG